MTKPPSERQLRVPVRYVDGVWESEYGGVVPIKPDTRAELILSRGAISDPVFLNRMEGKGRYKVAEQGTELLFMLNVKAESDISDRHRAVLIPSDPIRETIASEFFDSWSPAFLHFVRVRLGKRPRLRSTAMRPRTAAFGC